MSNLIYSWLGKMYLEYKLPEALDQGTPCVPMPDSIYHVGAMAWQLTCWMKRKYWSITRYFKIYLKGHLICGIIYDPLSLPPEKGDPSFLCCPIALFHYLLVLCFLSITESIMGILKADFISYLSLSFQAPSIKLHVYRITLLKLSVLS